MGIEFEKMIIKSLSDTFEKTKIGILPYWWRKMSKIYATAGCCSARHDTVRKAYRASSYI